MLSVVLAVLLAPAQLSRVCTIKDDCRNRATSVSGTQGTGCTCVCKNKFTGPDCAVCPAPFAGGNCDQCKSGFYDYANGCPQCLSPMAGKNCDECVASYYNPGAGCLWCNTTMYKGANCDQCANGYSGTVPNCNPCKAKYAGDSCEYCADARINWPGCSLCTLSDTPQGTCNGFEDSVWTDTAQTQCVCDCTEGWDGDACELCAAGWISWPSCTKCEPKVHCSDHAVSATDNGLRTGCVCTCRNNWTSADCSVCGVTFNVSDPGDDCGACRGGFVNYGMGVDGVCTQCNREANVPGGTCNGNAAKIVPANETHCKCVCKGNFEGLYCDRCKAGFINYPTCTKCDSNTHFFGHANVKTISSDPSRTTCTVGQCVDKWDPATNCQFCIAGVDEATNCKKCLPGRVGFPTCNQCTVAAICSNHAIGATDDGTRKYCICQCETGKDPLWDCQQCLDGRINYPSCVNSSAPTTSPTVSPTRAPTRSPTAEPTAGPTAAPSRSPSATPTATPSQTPSRAPSVPPTAAPSAAPTSTPTRRPSSTPTRAPSASPDTSAPSASPSVPPSPAPSRTPSRAPSRSPSLPPTAHPTGHPSPLPTAAPSTTPTRQPTATPSMTPSRAPSATPSATPSAAPSVPPTRGPSLPPTATPSRGPSATPTASPSRSPSRPPSPAPSRAPSLTPTARPSRSPSRGPSLRPSASPTAGPTLQPSASPSASPFHPTPSPSASPSAEPSRTPTASPLKPTTAPSASPSQEPSRAPSAQPSRRPSASPTRAPSTPPTAAPSRSPSASPTRAPSLPPTGHPTARPSAAPTAQPSASPSTSAPTAGPSAQPSRAPSAQPSTSAPTKGPSSVPSATPSGAPRSSAPSAAPSRSPSVSTAAPSLSPSRHACTDGSHGCDKSPGGVCVVVSGSEYSCTCKSGYVCVAGCGNSTLPHQCVLLTAAPSGSPSAAPSAGPSRTPTAQPSTSAPTRVPSVAPSATPTVSPVTPGPTAAPSRPPTPAPSATPSYPPTRAPTAEPTAAPSTLPSAAPSAAPSLPPSARPSTVPSVTPTSRPSPSPSLPPTRRPSRAADAPSVSPTQSPSATPTTAPQPAPTASPVCVGALSYHSGGLCLQCSIASHCSGVGQSVSVAPNRSGCVCECLPRHSQPVCASCTGSLQRYPDCVEAIPEEKVVVVTETAKAATGAAATAALVGGGATAAAGVGRLTVAKNLNCKVDDVDLEGAEPIDFEYHPIGIPLGSHGHMYFLGAVLFNPLIVGFFLVFAYTGVLLQVTGCMYAPNRRFEKVGRLAAEGNMRAPGIGYLPTLFLLQGTSLSASNMSFYPTRAPAFVCAVGVASFILCALIPVVFWRYVLQPRVFSARQTADPRLDAEANQRMREIDGYDEKLLTGCKRRMYIICFGTAIWVSTDDRPYFVERLGVLFEQYRDRCWWFAVAEQLNMLILSMLAAWQPHGTVDCHIRNGILCLILLVWLLLVVVLRPWLSILDNVVGIALSAMMFIAVAATTAAIAVDGASAAEPLFSVAGALLLFSAQLLMLKGVYDITLYLVDVKIKRRSRAMKVTREIAEAKAVKLLGEAEEGDAQPSQTSKVSLTHLNWDDDEPTSDSALVKPLIDSVGAETSTLTTLHFLDPTSPSPSGLNSQQSSPSRRGRGPQRGGREESSADSAHLLDRKKARRSMSQGSLMPEMLSWDDGPAERILNTLSPAGSRDGLGFASTLPPMRRASQSRTGHQSATPTHLKTPSPRWRRTSSNRPRRAGTGRGSALAAVVISESPLLSPSVASQRPSSPRKSRNATATGAAQSTWTNP